MLCAVFFFTSSTMLWFALAPLIPLLLHRFTPPRYRTIPWAAMALLLRAAERLQRRRQWEEWLLLATRMLMLLLFGLALADPQWLSGSGALPTGEQVPTHEIFVLDATSSLAYRDAERSLFDQARDALRNRVRAASSGDAFSLVLLAQEPQVRIGPPTFDRAVLLAELDSVRCSAAAGRADAALPLLQQLATTARELYPQLQRTRITFVGDGETFTWSSLREESAARNLAQLREQATLVWHGVPPAAPVSNRAVVRLELLETPVTVGQSFSILAHVAQWGDAPQPIKPPLATLLVNGITVAQQTVTLSSTGEGSVLFRHRLTDPGDAALEVRLAPDALSHDDVRFAAVKVREALRVLCLGPTDDDTRYLAAALAPQRDPAGRVQVREARPDALLTETLSSYDAICLANLPPLTLDQVRLLADFVRAGGGVLLFLGDQCDPATFLPPDEATASLFPFTLTGTSPQGNYRFDPLDYAHSLVAPFRGFENAGLLTTPVWKYVLTSIPSTGSVQVPLRFHTGDAAVLEQRYGRGSTLTFVIPASPRVVDRSINPPAPWTAWPAWPSFPPLIQEALGCVTRGPLAAQTLNVNEPLVVPVATAAPGSMVTLQLPDPAEPPRSVPLESTGDAWRWTWPGTATPGFYRAQIAASSDPATLYAVNADVQESPLAFLAAEALTALWQTSPNAPAADDPSVSPPPMSTPQPLFRWLLGSVLLLMVTEALLTARAGKGEA